jgi:membrane protease subunit (stomatin/prohibitin family)
MALFGQKKEGGSMDVIRCDEQQYLIWKWRPTGQANSTNKENAIRWGSSLRVKDGEVAIFVYKQNDGSMQDFIVGPYDESIKTANFPVLTNIIGLAYDSKSPFQAEIYFINLAGNIQFPFGVPYFDVIDPRFQDFYVPVSARGSITFNISDYKSFVKLHRMINFDVEDFTKQARDALAKYIKGCITNIPFEKGIPVIHLERQLLEINEWVKPHVESFFKNDFGVNLKRFDLATIEIDKDSEGYAELRKVTAVQQTKTIEAQTDINIKNLEETQSINAENVSESLRIQREQFELKQRLQSESQHLTAHQIDQQAAVLLAAAKGLGSMGSMNLGGGDGSGGSMNPAGMMTGLMLGGAMGGQMANMMNQVGQNIQQPQMSPPPPPKLQYSISINGQASGPFDWAQLQELVVNRQLNKNVHVWKQGMTNWELAGNVQELASLFSSSPPPPPPPNF